MARRHRVVLDSGALTALANRSREARFVLSTALEDGASLVIPSVVLAESLTGTPTDARTNAALALTTVLDIDGAIARAAATLRHARRLSRGATIDAIVVACADQVPDSIIFTSDPDDLRPLAAERALTRVIEIS